MTPRRPTPGGPDRRLAVVIPAWRVRHFAPALGSLRARTDRHFRVYIGDDAGAVIEIPEAHPDHETTPEPMAAMLSPTRRKWRAPDHVLARSIHDEAGGFVPRHGRVNQLALHAQVSKECCANARAPAAAPPTTC